MSGLYSKRGPGRYADWSRPSAAAGGVHGTQVRLFMSIDADDTDLVVVEESKVTSDMPSARPIKGGLLGSLRMTIEEAEWLVGVLPIAIARLKKDVAEVEEDSKKQSA